VRALRAGRRLLIPCALAAATSLTGITAAAQDVAAGPPVAFGIMAGGENVTGAFRGAFKPGIVLGTAVHLPVSVRRFTVRGDVMYHWIWEYGYACNENGCVDQGRHSHLVTGSVDMVARLNDPATRWSPYVVVGAAVNFTGNSDEKIVSYRPHQLGFQGGVGFDFRPWKTTTFVEVRYMDVSPGGILPVTIGMRF
jgi:hypothetical protein